MAKTKSPKTTRSHSTKPRPISFKDNPEQEGFVKTDARHSAYMGGVGAGKTFASILRGLRLMDENKVPVAGWEPCKGSFLALSEKNLKDFVYPAFNKVIRYNPGMGWTDEGTKSDMVWTNKRGQQVLMRSLDDPDRIRGIEISWFGIDEGRNFSTDYAYRVMTGRLRQGMDPDLFDDELDDFPDLPFMPGQTYRRGGWVTSTPNGYDWMYHRFHPKGSKRRDGTEWFNASTMANRRNLPPDYIKDLMMDYEGRFLRQEVYGEFVGAVSGAVFEMFDPDLHVTDVTYDPTLPLFSFWDFGIGDLGVCLFAQLEHVPKVLANYEIELVPNLRVVGCIAMKDRTSREWASAYWRWLEENTADDKHPRGRIPDSSWGDPAGAQRSAQGTSWLNALYAEGVTVIAAPKRPKDEAIIILQNLMEATDPVRFEVAEELTDLAQAIQTNHWKVDEAGDRLPGQLPVHDWTSHYCDALQYGALGVLSLYPQRRVLPQPQTKRGTFAFIQEQIFDSADPDEVVMGMDLEPARRLDWHPDRPVRWDEDLYD